MKAKNQADRVLEFIARSVKSRSATIILKLHLAPVRPRLDYATQFRSPYDRMDLGLLEEVERRMTEVIDGMRYFTYERRLMLPNLQSLERCRAKGDLIKLFKWFKGYNKG